MGLPILNYGVASQGPDPVASVLYIGVMRYRSLKIAGITLLCIALPALAGDAAPNLELHDLKGAHHKLEEYRGRPVVLNFWATWCVPCAAEMPLLNEMQRRYQGRVLFIAASVEDDDMKPAVQAFIKKHRGGDLTVMMGAELENLHDFGLAQAMPGTVFIDSEGNIVDRISGGLKRPDLEPRIKKLAGVPLPLAGDDKKKSPMKQSGK
jgi:thiol-disulfide isomerase/thioredoxin